jgi:hypothetical protein
MNFIEQTGAKRYIERVRGVQKVFKCQKTRESFNKSTPKDTYEHLGLSADRLSNVQ